MDLTKDNIKAWLKRSDRDRAWLADQLRVETKTVNNWLSSARPIPEAKLALIQRLQADDIAEEARQKQLKEPTNDVFNVEVDHERFRRYNAAAAANRQTMEEWTIQTLDDAVERITAVAGVPVRILESAAPSLPRSGPFLPFLPFVAVEKIALNEQPVKYTTGQGDRDPVTQTDQAL